LIEHFGKGTASLGILVAGLGVVAGLLGFAPYFLIERRIRAKVENQGIRSIQLGCLSAVVSFVVMAVTLVAVYFMMAERLLIFAATCIGVFLVCMIVYTVLLVRGQSRDREGK
jgi:Ca2+/Na+ antiporter